MEPDGYGAPDSGLKATDGCAHRKVQLSFANDVGPRLRRRARANGRSKTLL